ncbi:MAG: hypothetical protein IJ548_05840 [Paludibacteraceae bacterium]|nr:hypothetical protein [Paludibacteraceae bacterium]MBQ8715624.1 hypothetical protein [Prevotella sp.]
MKKLFTLLTLALISIGSAWGQETTTTIDFESGAIADVFTESNSAGVSTSIEALSTYEWSSGKKFSSAPTGSTKLFVTSLGSTKGTSTTLITKSSWVGITKISFYIASSDRGKTELAISVSPNADFSSDVTDVLTNTTLSDTDFGNTSNGTMKQLTFNLDEAKSGYVKIVLSQGSNSNNKIMALDNVVITNNPSAMKTIASEDLNGVKVGDVSLTKEASTNGYRIQLTDIILTDDLASVLAPTNITLTKKTTYTDETSKEEDITVEFDGTISSEKYVSKTVTIGEVSWVVKVPVDKTPTLEATPTAVSVVSAKSGTGSATISLTGGNLTGDATVEWASEVAGLTITPTTITIEEGEVNQEFTVSYKSNDDVAEATVNLTFTVGSKSVVVPVTYSSTAAVTEITNIGTATSFSWNNITPKSQVDQSENELILANVAALDFSEFGDASAIKLLKVQRPMYKSGSDWCAQAHGFAINTSIAGVLSIKFGGTNTNTRTITIDGEEFGSVNSTTAKTASVYIPAGEHTIMGYEGENSNNLRYYEINFEGLVAADEVTITDAGYATVVLSKDAYFDATPEVTAYAAKANGETIKLTEVKAAPAGTPLVIKGIADSYQLYQATTAPAAVSDNDLVAGPVTGGGSSYYVLGKEGSKVGFGLLASGAELPATKAYISADKFTEARAFIAIDSDVTGIKNIKVGSEDNIYYDLQGRRVLYPTKGLYIVNGKKVILK